MILSYKKQLPWKEATNFKQSIISGIKKHTIRQDISNRWKPGMKIHHAHGVRTPNYDCFLENECISIQQIKIQRHPFSDERLFRVWVDDKLLSANEILLLAKNDGFDSIDDFFKWFDKDFVGKIIHWTDFKY